MTSGKITRDPKPWLNNSSQRVVRKAEGDRYDDQYRPRAEFDNDDPIIASFRGLYQAATWEIRAKAARHYLASVRDMGIALGLSAVQAHHSRRVLTLIANIYDKE